MRIALWIFSLLVFGFRLLCDVQLLVEQYYSIVRFCLAKKSRFRDKIGYYSVITLFIGAGVLLFYYSHPYLADLLFILCLYLLSDGFLLKNYRLTRRNGFLLAGAVISAGTMSYFALFVFSSFPVLAFSLGMVWSSLLLSYLLLFPLELWIRRRYIVRARKKIKKMRPIVIGITGSFGKTTAKNFIYSLLKTHFLISEQNHNYNTVMGLCKYINRIVREEDQILLVEIGVDHPRSMKKFGALFSLDYAVVTSIGEMHLATFKSVENIAKEKISIARLLKPGGKLFVHREILNRYETMLPDCEVYSKEDLDFRGSYDYEIHYGGKTISTEILTPYQMDALACAVKIAEILHLNEREIEFGIRHLQIPSRRLKRYRKGIFSVIDDSYNANYEGVISDLDLLSKIEGRRIVVTGGLIELKEKFEVYNAEIGRRLIAFDLTIFIGEKDHPLIRALKNEKNSNVRIVSDWKEAYSILHLETEEATVLLLAKGSECFLR